MSSQKLPSRSNQWASCLALSLSVAVTFPTHAADVVKAGNTTAIGTAGSWVGGVLPSDTDTAVFNDIFTSTNNLGTGAGLTYLGIRIDGTLGTLITVNNTSYNNFVATGTGGIDMSAATRDLKIVGYVAADDQTWNITSGRTLTLGGTRFSGTGNVDITGNGTTVINADTAAAVYSGTLSVSGGLLKLNALEGGNVVVNDGGTLESEITLPGNLSLGSVTGATLRVDALSAESLTAADVTLTGVNTVELSALPSGTATADILTYTGTLAGDETNFQLLGGSDYRTAPTFADTGSAITLSFTAGDAITWTGSVDGNWDVNATSNWDNGAATNFFTGDSVTFDDTGANKNVTVLADSAPVAVTINNSAGNDYSFSGAATNGSGFTKSGNGKVTFLNSNSYSGNVDIQAGSVEVGNGGTVGTFESSGGDISVAVGATLSYNRSDAVNIGSRVVGGGELIHNGAGAFRTGQAGNDVDITVNSGTLEAYEGGWAVSYFATANRVITVNNGGTLKTDTHGLGGLGGGFQRPDLVINEGGTWTVNGGQYMNAGDITLNGGTINVTNTNLRLQGGTMTIGASANGSLVSGLNMSLYASPTFNVADGAAATDFTVSSIMNESGGARSLTKSGAGTMLLEAANTYTGNTNITEGALSLGTDGSIANSAKIDVQAGASFNVSAVSGGFALGDGQTLSGAGAVIGPIQLAQGSVIAPGNSAGTLTFDSAMILGVGSILDFELNGSDLTIGSDINDLMTGISDVTLDGTLNVTDLVTDAFLAASTGDRWVILEYTGTVTDNGLDLGVMPTLAPGLSFEIDQTQSNEIGLVVVPEPSSSALLALGGLALVFRRRK